MTGMSCCLFERRCDCLHDFRRAKQPGLDRRDRKMREQKLDLLAHITRVDGIDARDFSGHFGDHTSHRGHAKNAKRAEGFQVGLEPGASARVGACDR